MTSTQPIINNIGWYLISSVNAEPITSLVERLKSNIDATIEIHSDVYYYDEEWSINENFQNINWKKITSSDTSIPYLGYWVYVKVYNEPAYKILNNSIEKYTINDNLTVTDSNGTVSTSDYGLVWKTFDLFEIDPTDPEFYTKEFIVDYVDEPESIQHGGFYLDYDTANQTNVLQQSESNTGTMADEVYVRQGGPTWWWFGNDRADIYAYFRGDNNNSININSYNVKLNPPDVIPNMNNSKVKNKFRLIFQFARDFTAKDLIINAESQQEWTDAFHRYGYTIRAPHHGNGKYFANDTLMTWEDHNTYAENRGMKLVSIHNSSENQAVIDFASEKGLGSYWIGGQKINGIYEWADGSSWNYDNWDLNQPDNHGGAQEKVAMDVSTGTWNDIHKNSLLHAVYMFTDQYDGYNGTDRIFIPLANHDLSSNKWSFNDATNIKLKYKYSRTSESSHHELITSTRIIDNAFAGDNTAPTIVLHGDNPIHIPQNTTYTEYGATAIDNFDISYNIQISSNLDVTTEGDYTITYTATDNAGNQNSITRTVDVDASNPSITLNGNSTITINRGSVYNELGATANDPVFYGDITANIVITGSVNTAVAGSYSIYYNVTDASGKQATQVTRTVIVDEPSIGISLQTWSNINASSTLIFDKNITAVPNRSVKIEYRQTVQNSSKTVGDPWATLVANTTDSTVTFNKSTLEPYVYYDIKVTTLDNGSTYTINGNAVSTTFNYQVPYITKIQIGIRYNCHYTGSAYNTGSAYVGIASLKGAQYNQNYNNSTTLPDSNLGHIVHSLPNNPNILPYFGQNGGNTLLSHTVDIDIPGSSNYDFTHIYIRYRQYSLGDWWGSFGQSSRLNFNLMPNAGAGNPGLAFTIKNVTFSDGTVRDNGNDNLTIGGGYAGGQPYVGQGGSLVWSTYVGGWGTSSSRSRPTNRIHTGSSTISNAMAQSGSGHYFMECIAHRNQLFNLWGCATIDGQHVYRVFS